MRKSIRSQIHLCLERNDFWISLFLIFIFIAVNYVNNIVRYCDCDVSQMIHPMKLLMLETHNKWGFYFMQFFPFIIVFPAGFSYIYDSNRKTHTFLIARYGIKNYYYGKLISTFIVTFLAFMIPFFLEFILNILTFPLNATGDLSNAIPFDEEYIHMTKNYFMYEFWKCSPYVYTFFCLMIFSSIASAFSVFLVASSTFGIFKFRVLMFLPVYILLYILTAIGRITGLNFNYYTNICLFESSVRFDCLYIVISFVLIIISLFIVRYTANEVH